MPSVREILKENNMDLPISEAALNLEFEGNFVFTKTEMVRMGDTWNHPDEFVLGYFFFDGKDRLLIVPDDPPFVVNYTSYNGDSGYFEAYNSNGEISIIM